MSFYKTSWKEQICFNLNGVSFAHKSNPLGKLRVASTMARERPNKGLKRTTKVKRKKKWKDGKLICCNCMQEREIHIC